jgi:cytochrome c-type protein NapB
MCKTCHDKRDTFDATGKAEKVKGQPTAIPASHYIDNRFAPDRIGKTVVGARLVCTQCHVPQANVKPLVKNTFGD